MTAPVGLSDAVPGRPDEIAAAAEAFDGAARRWLALHEDLLARGTALADAWRGSVAATTALARVRHDAEAISRVGDACHAVVDPLRTFAADLRRAQQDWADGAAMTSPAPGTPAPDVVDGTNVMDSAVERARVANETAARAVRAAAAALADLVPPETPPPVVGQDGGTFGQGLWDAGVDEVAGIGALLGGTVDRLNPFGDRFGPAWASTVQTITAAVRDPLAAAESVAEGTVDPIVEAYRQGGLDEASGRALGAIAIAVGTRGVGEVGKLGELGTASRLGPRHDPSPGWHTSVERGPHTPLAPGGGLRQHEEAGGHTLDPARAHVGATDEQMLARQRASNRPIRVSSFYRQEIAERAVAENIAANQQKISDWLSQTDRPKQSISFVHSFPVGRSAPGSAELAHIVETTRSKAILRRDSSAPAGYFVLTSFPDP